MEIEIREGQRTPTSGTRQETIAATGRGTRPRRKTLSREQNLEAIRKRANDRLIQALKDSHDPQQVRGRTTAVRGTSWPPGTCESVSFYTQDSQDLYFYFSYIFTYIQTERD